MYFVKGQNLISQKFWLEIQKSEKVRPKTSLLFLRLIDVLDIGHFPETAETATTSN